MDGRPVVDDVNSAEEPTNQRDRSWRRKNVEKLFGQSQTSWSDYFRPDRPEPDRGSPERETDCMQLPIRGLRHSGMPVETKAALETPDPNPVKRSGSKNVSLVKPKSKRPTAAPSSPATVVSPQASGKAVEMFESEGALRLPPLIQPVVSLAPLDSPFTTATSTVQSATFSSSVYTLLQLPDEATAPVRRRQRMNQKYPPTKDIVYHPDKHYGVWKSETNGPCTNVITCNAHLLSLKRAVSGRSKSYGLLLKEYYAAKKAEKQEQVMVSFQMAVDGDFHPEASASHSSVNVPRTSITPTPLPFHPHLSTNVPKALSLLSINAPVNKTLSICNPRVTITHSNSAPKLQTST